MPSFRTDAYRTPWGVNVFLRSTQDVKTESGMVAASTVPKRTIDGVATKVLRKGTVMALITSGPESGKIGPFQGVGTDEVQTITENTAISAGTFTITILGATTAAIAWDATAAQVQTAIRAAVAAAYTAGDIDAAAAAIGDSLTVTGGPVGTTPLTVTYNGELGANVDQLTVDVTSLTGTVTVATSTPGVVGATDGRGTLANIVGLCNTELPWQLNDGDREVAIVYECSAVLTKCLEYDAAGTEIALTTTTADAMRSVRGMDILFK
ncbi:MAG: hypothetical protein AB7O86_05790 [Porticoccaceae bacterium]